MNCHLVVVGQVAVLGDTRHYVFFAWDAYRMIGSHPSVHGVVYAVVLVSLHVGLAHLGLDLVHHVLFFAIACAVLGCLRSAHYSGVPVRAAHLGLRLVKRRLVREMVSLVIHSRAAVESCAAVLGCVDLALGSIVVLLKGLLCLRFKLVEVIRLIWLPFQILSVLKRALWTTLRGAEGLSFFHCLGCLRSLKGSIQTGTGPRCPNSFHKICACLGLGKHRVVIFPADN